MKRRDLLAATIGAAAVMSARNAPAEPYRRIPYTPDVYEKALASREPVLFSFYASW